MIAPVYQPSQNCPQSKLRRARLGPSELNLPVTPEDQALIDRAVSASGLTRTDFGLQAARLAAQELLIEQIWLDVVAEPFVRFAAALDAPAHANERLQRTMAAPRP